MRVCQTIKQASLSIALLAATSFERPESASYLEDTLHTVGYRRVAVPKLPGLLSFLHEPSFPHKLPDELLHTLRFRKTQRGAGNETRLQWRRPTVSCGVAVAGIAVPCRAVPEAVSQERGQERGGRGHDI